MKYLVVILTLAIISVAQSSAPSSTAESKGQAATSVADLSSQVPAPRPDDVKSVDGLIYALYDVISGPAGDRDWNRFRSLFVPQARFTKAAKAADGSPIVRLLSVDDYVSRAGAAFKKEPFYEEAIVNRVQTFGNIAQVFSSYESRHAPGGKPFDRGINSIQMLHDGRRWWVLSILWDEERPDNPLPAEYVRKTDN